MPGQSGTVLMKRAAVLGKPIEHSLSPVLHSRAYEELGLTDWSYDRFEVDAPELADFLAGLDDSWRGLSLTMPLKDEALVLAETCSPAALQTGAVNTLVRTPTGWAGHNTDVHGLVAALSGAGVGTQVDPDRVLLLGSGATARSALAALAQLGTREVVLAVRHEARASTLAQARDHGFEVSQVSLDDAAADPARIVVSTLPAGAADGFADAVDTDGVDLTGAVWMDVVYADWPTAFGQVGRRLGATVVPGLDMLVHQAVRQVELMTGRTVTPEVVQQAGQAALGDS